MEAENKLKVEYGTIYSYGIGIDNMAVVIDADCGLLKFGDAERNMRSYYNESIEKYKKAGLEDICNNLIYIEFDRYAGVLTIEEICTFVNYMRLCSANGKKILEMFEMDKSELKVRLRELNEMGY